MNHPPKLAAMLLSLAPLVGACTVGDDPGDDAKAGDGLAGETPSGDRARTCAAGPTVQGVDVSYYEATIDWAKAKASGIDFAFVRVSDGKSFKDPKFAAYWASAKAAGVVRGAYQFFRPNQDVAGQADLMIAALAGTYAPGDLPPVIDVEATGGLAPATVAARVRTWVDRVKAAVGVAPIVYTGKYFWRDQVGGPASFGGNALWVAQYTSLCPDLPAPWTTWTFWQHSETGTVPGISGKVDLDTFNGTIDDLRAFAGAPAVGPGPTTPPDPTTPPAGKACASATLGRTVPSGACVQAARDSVWYQCNNGVWASPVDAVAQTGPAGACTESHPL